MATTAVPVLDYSGGPLYESVVHQGGGLVDAYCTVFANTTLSTSSISLNDTRYFAGTQSIVVSNAGPADVTYTVSHIPAGTVSMFAADDSEEPTPWPVPLIDAPASVVIATEKVVVPAGGDATIKLVFAPPTGLNVSQFPIYSGYISLATDAQCESHLVPYYGLAAAMYDLGVIKTNPLLGYPEPALFDNSTGQPQDGPTTYTLSGNDVPIIEFRIAGSPFFSVDLVNGNTTLSTSLSTRQHSFHHPRNLRRRLNLPHASPTLVSRALPLPDMLIAPPGPHAQSLGTIAALKYAYRNGASDAYDYLFNGTVLSTDGKSTVTVENGTYKMLLRVLKITGNPKIEADWETWLSPEITIARD